VPPLVQPAPSADADPLLPDRFQKWFAARGWSAREHQLALLAKARDDRSALLIAPTGAGKTLAGFLPTLVELSAAQHASLPPPLRGRSTPEGRREGVSRKHRTLQLTPRPSPSPQGRREYDRARSVASSPPAAA